MDRHWSDLNKEMQTLISRKDSFADGMEKLLELRASLFEAIAQMAETLPPEAFYHMPYAGAKGYHSKTLAYSIWHIFRIEDIVAHEMIARDRQVLFDQGFDRTVHAPIITTGNELDRQGIVVFSKQVDIRELCRYAQEVKRSTERLLTGLAHSDLKRRFGGDMNEKLRQTGCVSEDENAVWLIEYWCGKDVLGLIKMPFSRHWIMHVEAMRRIEDRLLRTSQRQSNRTKE